MVAIIRKAKKNKKSPTHAQPPCPLCKKANIIVLMNTDSLEYSKKVFIEYDNGKMDPTHELWYRPLWSCPRCKHKMDRGKATLHPFLLALKAGNKKYEEMQKKNE